MAKYSYTYSGSNAAFVFAGIATLPTDIAVLLEADQHKALQKNKFAKHLIDAGELAVEEVGDSKPASGRGKGAQSGKTDEGKGKDESKTAELTIDDVRKALTDLEITFAEDETLEQLQEKLAQATE